MRIRLSAAVLCAIGVALAAPGFFAASHAQQPPPPSVAIDNDDIGGVVTGPNGPEAGVWVIAETRDLPVRYIKIVVTDDQGRYVIPDLPKAKYDVWVRGYGLVDSAKATSEPGKQREPHRDAGAERGRRRAVLPGDLLVLDAEDPDAGRTGRPRRLRRQHEAAATGSTP